MVTSTQPWQLRFEHHGFSQIELDWVGGSIYFNPHQTVKADSVVIVTSCWPEALSGVRQMAIIRRWCTVIAPQACVDWLSDKGWPRELLYTSYDLDGMFIQLEAYTPIPALTPKEAIYKGLATIKRPWRTIARVKAHQDMPSFLPQVAKMIFPSGRQLLHLQCLFHQRQDQSVEQAWIEQSKESTWVIVGADFEEYAHCEKRIAELQSEHVLLADLVGDYRRQANLPVSLLTPLADAVISKGRLVQIFATQVTQRFDTVRLLADE